MQQTWLGIVACGFFVAVGCGGSTAASPGGGGQANEAPAGGGSGGGSAGTQPKPDAPSPQPGTSGSPGSSPGGVCAKLCVSTATFVFDSPLSWEELASGSLEACRNGDQECFTGVVPKRGEGGNSITFAGAQTWQGPTVWSPDEWKTIDYSWSSVDPGVLQDGDKFSLAFVSADRERALFAQAVTFETVIDCAGSCKSARYDLRGEGLGVGGAYGEDYGGTSVGGAAEAGSGG